MCNSIHFLLAKIAWNIFPFTFFPQNMSLLGRTYTDSSKLVSGKNYYFFKHLAAKK